MTPEQAEALRAPFPAHQIGKLPKGGVTLDFVGHAAVTSRLLEVDPEWNWEPVAFTPEGLPHVHIDGNDAVLWIRLTIGGITRLGVGIDSAKSADLEKKLISDALRNAAMRFGVALDLWSKEDLQGDGDDTADRPARRSQRQQRDAGPSQKEAKGAVLEAVGGDADVALAAWDAVGEAAFRNGGSLDAIKAAAAEWHGQHQDSGSPASPGGDAARAPQDEAGGDDGVGGAAPPAASTRKGPPAVPKRAAKP